MYVFVFMCVGVCVTIITKEEFMNLRVNEGGTWEKLDGEGRVEPTIVNRALTCEILKQ